MESKCLSAEAKPSALRNLQHEVSAPHDRERRIAYGRPCWSVGWIGVRANRHTYAGKERRHVIGRCYQIRILRDGTSFRWDDPWLLGDPISGRAVRPKKGARSVFFGNGRFYSN